MLPDSYKKALLALMKTLISSAISFFVGVLIALLIVAGVAGVQSWFKHRNDAPECVAGQPTPKQGCVITYPS